MSLKLKYFTVEEANLQLPAITQTIQAARQTKEKIELKVDEWRKVQKKLKASDEALIRGQVDFLAAQLETELNRITEMGCVPKDLDLGLVDFPARIDGKEGYLCWKEGEASVGFWHGLTEGFSGRRA